MRRLSDHRAGRTRRQPAWARLPDEKLLDVRLCDLGVSLEGQPVARRIRRLYGQLQERGLRLRPHVWVSSEWFSPDGVPGIGVPFYLAHDRLLKLERRMMLEAEGSSERQCMKILRHEAGHAYCTAYRLHYRKRWRDTFGRFSAPYPESYRPDPGSRRYVLHFESWYAQAHPAEDFAETFAVWLQPRSQWRRQYRGWPALRKLELVDELMAQISHTPAAVQSRRHVDPLRDLRMTLREHYRNKRRRFAREWPDFYDHHLQRIFSAERKHAGNEAAAAFLRRVRPEIREVVSGWTGVYQYAIDQVIRDMIDRCRELRLRVALREREARMQAMIMVTVQTMNYVHSGQQHFAL
jgi:hypothetical protein